MDEYHGDKFARWSQSLVNRVHNHLRERSVQPIVMLPDSKTAWTNFEYSKSASSPEVNVFDPDAHIEVMRLVPMTFKATGFDTFDALIRGFITDLEQYYYTVNDDAQRMPLADRRLFVMWRVRPEIKEVEGGTYMYYARLALQINHRKFAPSTRYDGTSSGEDDLVHATQYLKKLMDERGDRIAVKPTKMYVPDPDLRSIAEFAERAMRDVTGLASEPRYRASIREPNWDKLREQQQHAYWDQLKYGNKFKRLVDNDAREKAHSQPKVFDHRPGEAISRALALPGPHDADIHTRLMPPKHQR